MEIAKSMLDKRKEGLGPVGTEVERSWRLGSRCRA
jgi:hypothetical protein